MLPVSQVGSTSANNHLLPGMSNGGAGILQAAFDETNSPELFPEVEIVDVESEGGHEAEREEEGAGHNSNVSFPVLPAVEEFVSGITKLRELNCLTAESLSQKLSDPSVLEILTSQYQSLARLIARTGSNEQLASPVQRKRKRSQDCDTPNSKKTKTEAESEKTADIFDEDTRDDICSICLEPWWTGGDHKITSLKCGHLFGLSCITKWVDQSHNCPQCKAKAKKSEFRSLFVKNITAEDTSQRDRALLLLELEKESRRKHEQSEALLRRELENRTQKSEWMNQEITRLRDQLTTGGQMKAQQVSQGTVPSQSCSTTSSSSSAAHGSRNKFHVFQRIHVSQEGQCRVFDYSKDLGMTVVSQKSANPLFRGFGVKMLSRDFRPLSYQPLHTAAIRDMSFRPGSLDGMLLSCGLDKTALLFSVTSKVVVQKYSLNSTVWCCAWNTYDTNLFYAGMERGVVREFDIRRTDAHVRDVLDNGGSPISNLQFWRGTDAQGNFFQGLLIAQLQNLVFKQQVRNDFTDHILPQMKASVMNLSLHPSGKYLSSFRPGTSTAKCRYEVSDLRITDEEQQRRVTSRLHGMFDGGKMQAIISRNSLISRPETEEGLLAVTADHASNTVNVWDFDQRSNFQTLPCYDKALDIKPVVPSNGNFLGVLTDKDLVLYKWREGDSSQACTRVPIVV